MGESPADVFLGELARHHRVAPQPLPIRYRPLATAIVGERRVHVSTGVASRRALQRVGKRAATAGDTIHLAAPAPPVEVLAHELTHVAHRSPEPRFFADDRRGPEERKADEIARIMTRAPARPRTVASGGTISAAALAASISSSAGAPDTVQRVRIGGHRGQGAIATAPPATTTAATAASVVPQPSQPPQPPPREPAAETLSSAPGLLDQFDRILELLEDRILTELERRGGRYRGGF